MPEQEAASVNGGGKYYVNMNCSFIAKKGVTHNSVIACFSFQGLEGTTNGTNLDWQTASRVKRRGHDPVVVEETKISLFETEAVEQEDV